MIPQFGRKLFASPPDNLFEPSATENVMHRNVEIWEKRHERLEAVFQAKCEAFGQARKSPSWNFLCEERRDAWRARYDALERRVWNALCVANGWRKA